MKELIQGIRDVLIFFAIMIVLTLLMLYCSVELGTPNNETIGL